MMIELQNVSKVFARSDIKAIDDLSLSIPEGATVTLIGPSGCGKTTSMRLINRLEQATSGRVLVEDEDVATVDPVTLRRKIGYVIQQVGLFPHMTVARNVATVPRLLGWERQSIEKRTDELLDLVGLGAKGIRERYPHELSGGQRQRVGIARAMAAHPPVLLMDEPFGALDPITRVRLQQEFKEIFARLNQTVVFVTHDLDEAIRMGDRVAIMRDGRLLQYDTPEAILARPADDFVERFVGTDRALKRLNLMTAADLMQPSRGTRRASGPSIEPTATLLDALSRMLAQDLQAIDVVENGNVVGTLARAQLFAYQSQQLSEGRPR